MPNGNDMLNEMDFNKKLAEMKERGELLEFIAEQVYKINRRCPIEAERITIEAGRITALEGQNRKMFGVSGGIGGVITGVIIGVGNYIWNKLGQGQ